MLNAKLTLLREFHRRLHFIHLISSRDKWQTLKSQMCFLKGWETRVKERSWQH